MNEKEIAEIRRRFKHDKNGITKIRGCYVNDKKEIMSEFTQSIGLMSLEETESLFKILKKNFSGSLGKNLIDIEFSTQQVSDSDEHKLLMELKNSELENDDAVKHLYENIIQAYNSDENYLILLACDKYDVPFFGKDGEEQEDSTEVFSYFLCSVCPVKITKSALGYFVYDNSFRNIGADYAISAPEIGFMFPSFDDRSTNIYNALYYTKSISENHREVVDSIFNTKIPMPAAEQKETFQTLLAETVEDECSYDFVQSVHDSFTEMINDYKNSKEQEPLVVSKKDVKKILETCGASESHIQAFEEKYDVQFGANTEIPPQNLIDPKKIEMKTPDVIISVNPERSYMVETRIIDGVKYIMVRAEEGVEVNGINIHFDKELKQSEQ